MVDSHKPPEIYSSIDLSNKDLKATNDFLLYFTPIFRNVNNTEENINTHASFRCIHISNCVDVESLQMVPLSAHTITHHQHDLVFRLFVGPVWERAPFVTIRDKHEERSKMRLTIWSLSFRLQPFTLHEGTHI